MSSEMNFFGRKTSVFKACCHTHSTVSDAFFTPEQVLDFYGKNGYDAVFMTDHRTTQDVASYKKPANLSVYSGIEVHPAGPRGINWHILALGVPHPFPGAFATGQEAVEAINAAGGLAYAAHPYWCGYTSAEVMSLKNIAGIEVYNTSCRYIGKEYCMHTWDEMLDAGQLTYALAVDDTHHSHDLFRGWTMICARENTQDALINALRNGEFYSTMGPEITSLSFENGIFKAEFSPCETVVLVAKRSYGKCHCVPGYPLVTSYELASSAEFDVSGLPPGSFVRLQLQDAQGRYAWSNPVQI